jgi:peptidyl-prolyl cis-trans isomerase D
MAYDQRFPRFPMTMLDRMRRHKNWLKWSLILVCLAFVVFYIPDFLTNPVSDLAATDAVAVVEGREISGSQFLRNYQAQMNAYREAYGGISDQILRQLGVGPQVLQQMVDERAALAEAERLEIRVSDEEVRQRILSLPALQENGAFIGEQRYIQLLNAQRPPVTPAEFEQSLRQALAIDKLRAIVTGWLTVSDAEVEAEYRRQRETVRLAVARLPVASFRSDVTVSDAEVAAYFAANEEAFRIPEKRRIRFVLVDVEAERLKTIVPDADVERFYNENFEMYSTPDEIRAAHILLRIEDQDEAAVRAQAEDLLAKIRAGADFGELAREHSADSATAPAGGDLGFFRRGQMVPVFEDTAFALEEGAVSDLVRSDFGFHIIKLLERRAGASRNLESVREEIVEQLAEERAQTAAAEIAERVAAAVTDPGALDDVAAANGLTVQESEPFAADEPITGIGPAPAVASRVFAMSETDVSGVMPSPRGPVVATLAERQESYVPELEEVRERVRAALVTDRAMALAREKAAGLVPRLRSASNFETAATAAGFEVETTEPLTRDSPVESIGAAPDLMKTAFALEPGAVSEPLNTEAGVAVIKVVEKDLVDAEELARDRDRFREEMLNERRTRLFSAYMTRAKQNMAIQVNREALQRWIG